MAKIEVKSNRKTYTSEFTPADTDRGVFLGHPQIDSLFSAVSALGAEVWALRRRMHVHESLLEKHGSITKEMIQKYEPTEAETKAMADERNEIVKNIFDGFTRRGDIVYSSSLHPMHDK
ncbi:MAG: hypothetical protein FJX59_01790 [Alphaproteobacteria bacterium]|nr:hypothetical protein [Alphaproteobacteria bacterium]